MISLLHETGLTAIVAVAIIAGYLIGIAAREELENGLKKIRIETIFSYPLIIAEVIILSVVLYSFNSYYFLTGGVLTLINIVLSAVYTARKSDLQRTINYAVLFLIPSLIIGAIIII